MEYNFEDFAGQVDNKNKEFVTAINDALIKDGYIIKVENKASGFFVSYSDPKTKRSLLNFLFRKNGFLARIYADNFKLYADFVKALPEKMEREIAKAPACKRLINPADCNPKCPTGYDFDINGRRYQKCRYGCFQFEVTPESVPVISEFVGNEIKIRREDAKEIRL